MGRDERFKQEELGRHMQTFAQAVAAGDARTLPRDRFGVAVQVGTKVLYRPNVDMIFDVVDVRPVLDTRVGAGVVTIVLQTTAPITCRVGQPLVSMIVVGVAGQQDGATAPADPPPADPPADTPAEGGLHLVPPSDEPRGE